MLSQLTYRMPYVTLKTVDSNNEWSAVRLRVITHRAVVEFSDKHPNAASALDAWYRTIKGGEFHNLAELKATFPSVDLIKATIYVFNIGGNTARLVASIHFNTQRIFILAILTHAEYDKDQWK